MEKDITKKGATSTPRGRPVQDRHSLDSDMEVFFLDKAGPTIPESHGKARVARQEGQGEVCSRKEEGLVCWEVCCRKEEGLGGHSTSDFARNHDILPRHGGHGRKHRRHSEDGFLRDGGAGDGGGGQRTPVQKAAVEVEGQAAGSVGVQEKDREEIGYRRCGNMHPLHKKVLGARRVSVSHVAQYGHRPSVDHTPHPLFVEMDELEEKAWVETARWIKYEEDLEAGHWGAAHVASLSFHSLLNLRRCLEGGALMLDTSVRDLPELLHLVVEELAEQGSVREELKARVLEVLMYRHRHVHPNSFKHLVLDMDNSSDEEEGAEVPKRGPDIRACLEEGAEGSIVLVGALEELDGPVMAFVRLAEAIVMPNTIEVSLPVRFLVILLTPARDLDMDHHEIGRSIATLMANPAFHDVCYGVRGKQDLLHGISEFLDESVVLPPGDWDRRELLPMGQMIDMRRRRRARKEGRGLLKGELKEQEARGPGPRNPLERTSRPFGGLLDDVRHRYVHYWSDVTDGLDSQCIAATIFIYFAALSGAVAFGGLLGDKTESSIGISETLVVSSVAGLLFALFSGCPLIIIGVTGPVLLYDEALYRFCSSNLPHQFLPIRVWIGIWTFLISLVVAAFQGSTLVRYFTRFTKDIFAGLVALLFIFEALNKLVGIFSAHPLRTVRDYCGQLPDHCRELAEGEDCVYQVQPNTALLSLILMFSTFTIAFTLRIFRNSQFLARSIRRALGDFGVPIAIVTMVLVDWSAGDTVTEKLNVPEGLQVTDSSSRGWLIPPLGSPAAPLPVWAVLAAVLPALLLYTLLFMETHICELIMMEKTLEKKGAGVHLDIVLLSLLNMGSGVVGGPWVCAATVRAVSHVSALTVMSTANVPGEAPRVVGVRDQRLTPALVSLLLGASVLMAPALKLVPFAVLFGVFLYMGVSGMQGIQFFDRVKLALMPVKHHPNVSYVTHVKTTRMVLFTILQALGLAVLWTVKSITSIALAFPLFVILMIPYRFSLSLLFSKAELAALDGARAGTNLSGVRPEGEERDFYETAADCPVGRPAVQMKYRCDRVDSKSC